MICRKIHRKNSWSFYQWWRCVHSATTDQRVISDLGSLSRASAHICTNPRKLVCLKNHYNGDFRSVPFGIKRCNFTTQATGDVAIGGMVDVPLAQTGEGIAECELLKWFVQEGDEVEEFQPVCEVQSDKATIEITSRYKGKVFMVLHDPGSIVKVGETLFKMVVDENDLSDHFSKASEKTETLESNISELDVSDSELRKVKIGGMLSTPVVRNFAKELGVNIEDVHGTGKEGRVLREDVQKYAEQQGTLKESSALLKSSPDIERDRRQDYEDKTLLLRGFQRAMVKSMTLAAKIPHFHYVEEINCGALVELKASLQSENSDPDVKYTFLPLLIKSLSMTLSKYPLLNSYFKEELHEVTLKGSHNVGIAMATPHGLVVPNIKKVQSLSIFEITKELSRLQQLAMANKLTPDDISGGTITLSNIGAIGGKFGSPLINMPEVSIIALGRIQKIPQFEKDGDVYPASIMTVNIGADHRVLDGATVARFCNEWKLYIEKPELLMLNMR